MVLPHARVRARNAFRRHAPPASALLALAGIVYAAAGIASHLAAGTRRHRRAAAILYRRWTVIPAIAGAGTLRIHSRLRDVMTHRDPIVLVHGRGGGSYLVPLAARISDHAPVFVPDLPGHGPSDGDARTLDVHIRRLRQKLDKCGDCIETVVGVGYRFIGCR